MSQYATLSEANTYFNDRLHAGLWFEQPTEDRDKALVHATRLIDRLAFSGEKNAAHVKRESIDKEVLSQDDIDAIIAAGATQTLEFPRGSDTTVPEDIKIACYEIAFALLDGRDPDKEFEELAKIQDAFSVVKTTYDRSFAQEHLQAGIPSFLAWKYLRPYLSSEDDVILSRVS